MTDPDQEGPDPYGSEYTTVQHFWNNFSAEPDSKVESEPHRSS